MGLLDLPGDHRMVVNLLHLVLGERVKGQTDLHMLTNLHRTLDASQAARFWRRVERIDRESSGEGEACPEDSPSRDLTGRSEIEPMPGAPGPILEPEPRTGSLPA